MTIRRFPERALTLDELVIDCSAMTPEAAELLKVCVGARLNLLISGGTGSGKTTLLGALASYIGSRERIVTIEDTAELRLQHNHVVTLQAAPPNAEGKGGVNCYDLLKNSLRMRPDRIIVGECRGPEAFDMVQAMSTGHDGSMSTLHANTPTEAVYRLQAMMSGANGAEDRLIRFQLGNAVDIIVQAARFEDGRRRVTHISEVVGYDARRDQVLLEPIYQWSHEADALRYTGYVPTFIDRVVSRTAANPGEILCWK